MVDTLCLRHRSEIYALLLILHPRSLLVDVRQSRLRLRRRGLRLGHRLGSLYGFGILHRLSGTRLGCGFRRQLLSRSNGFFRGGCRIRRHFILRVGRLGLALSNNFGLNDAVSRRILRACIGHFPDLRRIVDFKYVVYAALKVDRGFTAGTGFGSGFSLLQGFIADPLCLCNCTLFHASLEELERIGVPRQHLGGNGAKVGHGDASLPTPLLIDGLRTELLNGLLHRLGFGDSVVHKIKNAFGREVRPDGIVGLHHGIHNILAERRGEHFVGTLQQALGDTARLVMHTAPQLAVALFVNLRHFRGFRFCGGFNPNFRRRLRGLRCRLRGTSSRGGFLRRLGVRINVCVCICIDVSRHADTGIFRNGGRVNRRRFARRTRALVRGLRTFGSAHHLHLAVAAERPKGCTHAEARSEAFTHALTEAFIPLLVSSAVGRHSLEIRLCHFFSTFLEPLLDHGCRDGLPTRSCACLSDLTQALVEESGFHAATNGADTAHRSGGHDWCNHAASRLISLLAVVLSDLACGLAAGHQAFCGT